MSNKLEKALVTLYSQINDEYNPQNVVRIQVSTNVADENNIWEGERITLVTPYDTGVEKRYPDISNFELKNSFIELYYVENNGQNTILSQGHPLFIQYDYSGSSGECCYIYFLAQGKFQSIYFPPQE